MVDDGILDYVDMTGKGGHHRIYRHRYSESGFKEYLAAFFVRKLLNEFPEETRKAIEASH